MKKNITLNIFLLSILFITSACSKFSNMTPPEVALSDLRIGNVTFFQTSAIASVRIDNENDWDIESSGGVYKLYVNGKYLGKSLDKEGFSVPRFSSATKQLTLTIDNLSLLNQIEPMMNKGNADYRLDGVVFLVEPIERKISVSKSGEVNILNNLQ